LLLAGNPIPDAPPRQRARGYLAILVHNANGKTIQGHMVERRQLGLYAPTLERETRREDCRASMARA